MSAYFRTVATTLRLADAHGHNQSEDSLIIADSWFSSLAAAGHLIERNHEIILNIKRVGIVQGRGALVLAIANRSPSSEALKPRLPNNKNQSETNEPQKIGGQCGRGGMIARRRTHRQSNDAEEGIIESRKIARGDFSEGKERSLYQKVGSWAISSPGTQGLAAVCSLLFLILFVHEAYYYQQLTMIELPIKASEPPVNISLAQTAVVSLHKGAKFWGYLGTWLQSTKRAYAENHSYGYFDHLPAESELTPLGTDWHRSHAIFFEKLRVLLYVMETYPNVHSILWLDGDSVVANPRVLIRDRFLEHAACMIWAADAMGPNAGILLLANTKVTQQLLQDALSFIPQDRTFYDQSALVELMDTNATYSRCMIVESRARQLQSRVRGPENFLFQKGDWILHLPNHNRWELLKSLTKWLPKRSPHTIPHKAADND